MSLRIQGSGIVLESTGGSSNAQDDWGTRIAKLIPAEALGLYGSAVALVPPDAPSRRIALIVIAAICCFVSCLVRIRSTRNLQTDRPQYVAVVIALVSFLIWLIALGYPASPIGLPPQLAYVGPLCAFIWGTMVPYYYKGDG